MHNANGINMEYTTSNTTPPIAITPEWMDKRFDWSLGTFGRGCQTKRLIAHIQCELKEIEAAPDDLMEWVDLLLLAFDGAARAGHSSKAVIKGIHEKHKINLAREWPRRESDEEGPIFHAKQEAIIPDKLAEAISHLHEVAYGNVPTVMLAYDNAIANVNKKHVRTILDALATSRQEVAQLRKRIDDGVALCRRTEERNEARQRAEKAEAKLRDKEEAWAIASASMGEAKGKAEADAKMLRTTIRNACIACPKKADADGVGVPCDHDQSLCELTGWRGESCPNCKGFQRQIDAILKKLCPYYSEENGDDPDCICWCCNSVRDILQGKA